jgi:hypothetical protein
MCIENALWRKPRALPPHFAQTLAVLHEKSPRNPGSGVFIFPATSADSLKINRLLRWRAAARCQSRLTIDAAAEKRIRSMESAVTALAADETVDGPCVPPG